MQSVAAAVVRGKGEEEGGRERGEEGAQGRGVIPRGELVRQGEGAGKKRAEGGGGRAGGGVQSTVYIHVGCLQQGIIGRSRSHIGAPREVRAHRMDHPPARVLCVCVSVYVWKCVSVNMCVCVRVRACECS